MFKVETRSVIEIKFVMFLDFEAFMREEMKLKSEFLVN